MKKELVIKIVSKEGTELVFPLELLVQEVGMKGLKACAKDGLKMYGMSRVKEVL